MAGKIVINAKNMNIGQGNTNNGIISIGDNNTNNIVVKNKKARREKTQGYEKMKEPYIFISYSHKDIPKVMPIIQIMKRDGYRVWYDRDITPGQKWDWYLEGVLSHCDIFIAFLSHSYWKSGPCKEEISYACNLPQFESDGIIPVCLDETNIPSHLGLQMHLSSRQRINGYRYATAEEVCRKIYKNNLIHKCHIDREI